MKMELHYFTFGLGHTFAGHCQPILAHNAQSALKKMFDTYGDKWAFHYTADQWEQLKQEGHARERMLDLLVVKGVSLSECTP